MQAGTAVGNLASAIGFSGEEAGFIADLKAGSEDAFAVLIAQYHQSLYSLIARSVHDPADAADITQDVFLKVFRSIHSFHGDSSLRTWLYRIALREASNQRRWWRRHKRQEITLDTPAETADDDAPALCSILATTDPSPFDHARESELRVRVESALRDLPEGFRHVVVLREIEGLSYDEIADVLQLRIGTVKSRLTRGRQLLRSSLESQRVSAPFTATARVAAACSAEDCRSAPTPEGNHSQIVGDLA